jgi:polar amino acid transport system permease protein
VCYIALFRGTPMVVQLLIGYWVLLPLMGITVNSGIPVAVIVFGLNSGAYVSEIMRGGINSVDKGQMEAGRAVGLTYATTMLRIVVPQAIKNILPTLGNEFIVLIKETSIVSFIAVTDLYKSFKQLGDPTYNYTMPYLMLALTYLAMVLLISWGIRMLEAIMKKSER